MCDYSTEKAMFDQHIETNIKEENVCDMCNFSTQTSALLKEHIQSHFEVELHKCTVCDYTTETPDLLKLHIIQTHKEETQKCDKCDYWTVTAASLKKHIQTHLQECTASEYTTEKPSLLKLLLQTHKDETQKCDKCGYIILTAASLKEHIKTHHNVEKTYSSDICHNSTATSALLQECINKQKPPQNKTTDLLTRYKVIHCTICDYRTIRNRYLKRHMLKHSDISSYKCTTCDYNSPKMKNLNEHIMLMHSGLETHKCDSCNYITTKLQNLKRHTLKHRSKKIYQCDNCNYSTHNIHCMRKHVQVTQSNTSNHSQCIITRSRPRGLSLQLDRASQGTSASRLSDARLSARATRFPRKMTSRAYCAVDGCTSQKTNKELSFFVLPKDEERRNKWLEIINRPDLKKPYVKFNSHVVCSKHFPKSSITSRPLLKPDAMPTSFDQESGTCDQATQTIGINILSKGSSNQIIYLVCGPGLRIVQKANYHSDYAQTDQSETKSENTQTSNNLSANTPRKRKISNSLRESNAKNRKLQFQLKKNREEVQSKESEKFKRFTFETEDEVTKRFCKLIEWQSYIRKHAIIGNRFDPEFKLFALNLHISSPQTYRCLKTFLRLPSEATLSRFKMIIPAKLEDRTFNFLSAKLKSLPKQAKYCTLSLDEMVLKRHLHYDAKRDEIIGLHNINGEVTEEIASHACATMLRGIYVNWKQPIAYSFLHSAKHYKDLECWLDEIITKLFNIGIDVKAVISNQGSNFDKYAKDIKKVTAENPYFVLNGKKIYYIFDVPHLIKCVRNNLITNDFKVDDNVISWKHIESLYSQQKDTNLKMIPRVTEIHIYPNNFQKMHFNYAAQIFSSSVHAALNTLICAEKISEEAKATAAFVEQINNLFDVLNSSPVQCNYKYKKAFSIKKYQTDVLENALKTFRKLIAVDRRTGKNNTNRIKTFKNIQISIQAILMLATDLKEEGFKYLYTRRLNQDCLENFFGAIRQQVGNCRDPTPIQFERAFSKLFLCNMLKNSRYSNCQEDICDLLENRNTVYEKPKPSESKTQSSSVVLGGDTDYRFDVPTENALNYISGYLLFKCTKRHTCPALASHLENIPDLSTSRMFTHFEAYNKSATFYGSLKAPPDAFNDYIRSLETAFLEHFRANLMKSPGSNLYDILKRIHFDFTCPCFPHDYLIKLFIRFRVFTTIKMNNREFRVGEKQIAHFIKLQHL